MKPYMMTAKQPYSRPPLHTPLCAEYKPVSLSTDTQTTQIPSAHRGERICLFSTSAPIALRASTSPKYFLNSLTKILYYLSSISAFLSGRPLGFYHPPPHLLLPYLQYGLLYVLALEGLPGRGWTCRSILNWPLW